MAGRNPKSIDLGLMQQMFLPIYHITWQPHFERGAKRELRDESGKLLYSDRWMQISTSGYSYAHNGKIVSIPSFVLEKDLKTTIENLENNGCKNLQITRMSTQIPKYCPSCEHEGTATCQLDTRYETQPRFVRIWYNHTNTEPKRCFVGTYDVRTGGTKRKEGIDIRKFSRTYWLMSKFNGFAQFPIPNARKRETTHQILKRLNIQ